MSAKLSAIMMTIITASAVLLRFYQLLSFTNSETGLIIQNGNAISYSVYTAFAAVLILCVIFAHQKKKEILTGPTGDIFISKKIKWISILLSVSFFYDFIHQCYNCFSYVDRTAYFKNGDLIMLALVGLLAIMSSFYFITVSLTASRVNYDFRNLRLFHFVPVLWLFARLLGILRQIIDVSAGIETVFEFFYLVFALFFLFAFIIAIEERIKLFSASFTISAIMLFISSCILSLPRILVYLIGKNEVLYNVDFSCVTDLMLGVFALCILHRRVSVRQNQN